MGRPDTRVRAAGGGSAGPGADPPPGPSVAATIGPRRSMPSAPPRGRWSAAGLRALTTFGATFHHPRRRHAGSKWRRAPAVTRPGSGPIRRRPVGDRLDPSETGADAGKRIPPSAPGRPGAVQTVSSLAAPPVRRPDDILRLPGRSGPRHAPVAHRRPASLRGGPTTAPSPPITRAAGRRGEVSTSSTRSDRKGSGRDSGGEAGGTRLDDVRPPLAPLALSDERPGPARPVGSVCAVHASPLRRPLRARLGAG